MIDPFTNASPHYQNAQRGKNRDRLTPIIPSEERRGPLFWALFFSAAACAAAGLVWFIQAGCSL